MNLLIQNAEIKNGEIDFGRPKFKLQLLIQVKFAT